MLALNKKTLGGALLGALALATAAYAATAQEAGDARHQGMKDIGKATKAAFAESKKPTPDIAVFKSSAADLALATTKFPEWFPAGSGPDKIKTEATATIWTDQAGFAAAVAAYVTAAKDFQTAAQSGDVEAAKAKLGAVGASCKGCHEKYREKD